MKTLLVHVLIAAVLICPLSCFARAVAANDQAIKAGSVACCDRCRGPHDPTEGRSQDRHGPDQDGRPCFCAGTLVDAVGRTPVVTLLLFSHWVLAFDSASQLESLMPERMTINADVPPLVMSGRQVRIVNLSFLI